MNKAFIILFLFFLNISAYAQKDSLQIGDRYAEDQIYASISYAMFVNQPKLITKSDFSYAISTGFIKDFILNNKGTLSFAVGFGYGYDFFNHKLKIEELNNSTNFSSSADINSNVFKSHNLEFPVEFRWRSSTANRYDFWRIYGGVKFLYNLSNKVEFKENDVKYTYKNVSSYNKFQYGLTLSAGYDEFNINLYYNLTPLFKDATIGDENINTRTIKFGLIFYIL